MDNVALFYDTFRPLEKIVGGLILPRRHCRSNFKK